MPETSDPVTSDTDALSDEMLLSILDEVTADTCGGQLDFDRACTGPEQRCWLCTELTPWNLVMQGHHLMFELVELRPGKLCLRSNPRGDGFIERDHANDAAEASFCVSWLLQHHRCIDELKVAYGMCLEDFGEKETPFPISLRPAAGNDSRRTLRGLVLEQSASACSDNSEPLDCFELVDLDAIGGLERLKIYFNYIKPKFAAELAKLLRRNASSIKSLVISDMMVPHQVNHALRYLFSCESLTISSERGWRDRLPSVSSVTRLMHSSTALKELTIGPIVSRRHIPAIAKELEANTSLTKLSLHMVERSCCPEAVFAALQVNTTLTELRVTYWHTTNDCAQALALLLRKNTGLRVLYIENVHTSQFCLIQMADALTVNTTLESLHISSRVLPMNGILALCKALTSNKTLKKLLLTDFQSPQELRAILARQLTQHDCYGRVQLHWTKHDLPGVTAALTSSFASFEELRLPDIRSLSVTGLKQLFDALASNACVHTLRVSIRGDPGEKGTALCEMLKVNRSIKCLNLFIDKDRYKFVEEISHALAENTTITEIELSFDRVVCSETAAYLSYFLAHNRTASKFFLRSHKIRVDSEFMEEFSQGMLRNRTVVKFGMTTNFMCNNACFPFFEAVRRNRGALNRAVDFVVSPSLDRQCAEGFERFSGRPCLLKHLKKATGKTEPEALLAIAAAERYLRDNYLLITGVVRHSVKCHPAKGTQVDALNEDCWLAIVRHLKIADVLTESLSLAHWFSA